MRQVSEIAKPDEPAGVAFYRWLETEIITEENTDIIIGIVSKYLAPIPSPITMYVLDAILPGALLTAVKKVLQALGQYPTDRYLSPLNPFTQ